MRAYNFSPGPAMLPQAVIEKMQEELLDWNSSKMSVMEISHRAPDFQEVIDRTDAALRRLIHIPSDYTPLYISGGASLQFAMIPLNLMNRTGKGAYVQTGLWSQKAIVEGRLLGDVVIAADSKPQGYTTIPDFNAWHIPQDVGYLHYTDNETVHGLEFSYRPEVGDIPLICDVSSNFLSRPIDISKHGLLYATAQKNLGIAGLTLVLIRNDLLQVEPLPRTPSLLQYRSYAKAQSMPNTPTTFAWYVMGLMFEWIEREGGIPEMEKRCLRRSQKIYEYIDQSDFYSNPVDPRYRSRINAIFWLKDEGLDHLFIEEALKENITNIKGHRELGGMRASMYNSMPETGVDTLVEFMKAFEKRHG